MFSGSLVAIVTPMHADGGLDYEAWSRLIDLHLENGTSGIVVGGTTGESATLSDAELQELTQRACAQVRGRIQVITGAGTSSTATTVERVRWVSQLPVDGVLIVTPAYNRPTQEGLFRHYQAAAAASRAPVIAYNVPSRTAVDMLPATVGRIAQLRQVAAVKEAVPSVSRVREIQSLVPASFAVLSGDDASARETVQAGARGVISVTANVAPRAMADMIAAALRGDAAGAAKLDAGLAPLHANLFLEANPIPAKWALARMGLMGAGVRLPLTELAAQFRPDLERALHQAGVLR
ncbi:MAG TPA: 4-hydroxy-tetrahydrodipicolinate synthase [Steroidobacteraceae bacterium]|jgi:4-hydroxy-tetrahydrodipicolinate synthase|nr:4-hydroxy-tetrahydrodipicolinate synthase [Steroidobacteraceae bacterium]